MRAWQQNQAYYVLNGEHDRLNETYEQLETSHSQMSRLQIEAILQSESVQKSNEKLADEVSKKPKSNWFGLKKKQ